MNDAQIHEYRHHMAAAAEALAAAMRTGVGNEAEAVVELVATVAANLGGAERLTATRPGSWEAGRVREMLVSLLGEDHRDLLSYRTAPIVLVACAEEMLIPDGHVTDPYVDALMVVDRAEDSATDPDAAAERFDRADDLIADLRTADTEAYRAAFEAEVRRSAAELGVSTGVAVTVEWVDWRTFEQTIERQDRWDGIESELWEIARANTPPPGEVLRRIPELEHYADSDRSEAPQ